MTKQEYKEYTQTVDKFFKDNALRNLSVKSSDDGDSCESYFSWQGCKVCGSSLGGDRFDCDGYSEKHGVMEFNGVCVDCVYFAEYGQLDDTTMAELE